MTLKEAVESGKPFRRVGRQIGGVAKWFRFERGGLLLELDWGNCWYDSILVPDAIANDWETCE